MKKQILIASFQSLNKENADAMAKIGYLLSEKFHEKGMLQHFVVSSKGPYKTTFPSKPVSIFSRIYLKIINKINIVEYKSRFLQEWLYDFFCVAHVNKHTVALVVTSPFMKRTFKKAARKNIPVVYIPGNPEENFIHKLVKEENEKYNIRQIDAYTYKKRLNYYNESLPYIDYVIPFTSLMEESYKTVHSNYRILSVRGFLMPNLTITHPKQKNGTFKIVFLSYNVLLKGLQYVLEAWEHLQDEKMELHVAGPLDDTVQHIINEKYTHLKNVYYHGKITDLKSFYEDKNLYLLTSIIDGAPVSILEAMSCSLPVICSENCGTKDAIEEGVTGWVVPIRDVEAIKEKIRLAYRHPEQTAEMGIKAAAAVKHYDMNQLIIQIQKQIEGILP